MQDIPTRKEFMFMPEWQIGLFYGLMAVSTFALGWQVWQRARLWLKGRPIWWKPDHLGGLTRYVLGQKKVRTFRPKSGAPIHLLVFYGFFGLFVATTLLAINTYSPWKFHKGTYFLVYEFIFDWVGVLLVVGLVWAMIRRSLFRPASLASNASDYATIGLLIIIAVTGYIVEAARMKVDPQWFDSSAPVGNFVSKFLPSISPQGYVGIWWTHALLVSVFIITIPMLRLRHILYAMFSAAGFDPDAHMGVLRPVSLEEVEKTGKIGVSHASDYSRWHLMSLDACMECGRCTDVCPAWNVGKTLNPKTVAQSVRTAIKSDEVIIADAITEDALWACTTCNACVEACPVLIRHVDLIVEARRWLVAEGRLSGTAATMLKQLQATSSAWGQARDEREKWMEGFEIPLVRDLVRKVEQFEVLFWIGCTGATDPNAIKTNRSTAALLKKAGVKFACLGKEEVCSGDPARRAGDEFLFQQLAEQNIAIFNQYGVKTIVTACPHCFNTMKNEYPQYKGKYEVLHHTQLLARLVDEGRLMTPQFANGEITLHDPCYLARANGESDAPRRALGVHSDYNRCETPLGEWLNEPMETQNRLAEVEQHGRKTLCCGAGGARMWMEEEPNERPSTRRALQLLQTGAKTIAVACPFCRIMLDAGVNQAAQGSGVELRDIAELLRDAND